MTKHPQKPKPRGRNGGRPKGSGLKPEGEKAVTRSVSMPPALWSRIDALRGERSRGEFIASLVAGAAK